MQDQLFYSTGKAATELGVPQAQIRALCESGVIATEQTPGGQWRISKSELDRLKAEGLPTIPRPLPGTESRRPTSNRNGVPPALYAEPSEQVVSAAEEVVILENEVKSLGLRLQKEEALDWFRQRQVEERAVQEEREREAQEIRAEEAARREREEWLQSLEAYGLNLLPYDCPPDVRLEAHEAIRARLAMLNPAPSASGSQRIVDAIVERRIAEWKRDIKIEEILIEARDRMLPYAARGSWGEITDWQLRALKASGAAILELRDDAPIEEIRAAAVRAVQGVAAEFEADRAAKADAEMRNCIIHAPLPYWVSPDGREGMEKLIEETLAALPVGTPRAKLEELRQRFLNDVEEAFRKRQAAVQKPQPAKSGPPEPQPLVHRPPKVNRSELATGFHKPPAVCRRP